VRLTSIVLTALAVAISESEPLLIDEQKLKNYLESKYFSKLSTEVERSLLRSLWKFVFRSRDEQCDKNRQINYRALKIICTRNTKNVPVWVEEEKDYYSNIATDGQPVIFFVDFLAKWPKLYELLTEAAKIKIDYCIHNENIGRCFGWFIKPNLDAHYTDLLEWIEGDDYPSLIDRTFKNLLLISDTPEWESSVANLASAYYCTSRDFDCADKRFEQGVKPLIGKYNRDNLIFLLERIEKNKQVYRRKAAKTDHRLIQERCDEVIGKDYDYQQFPHFIDSLRHC
jgi:hypothetical protein